MSILPVLSLFANTTALSTPATQNAVQSISIPALTSGEWMTVIGCAATALFVAFYVGAFNLRSILGPPRITTGASTIILWMIALGGFAASVFTQAVCLAVMGVKPEALSLHQTVLISCVGTAVGFGVIGLVHAFLDSEGMNRLGFGWATFPRGIQTGLIGSLVATPMMFAVTALVEQFWRLAHFAPPEEHILLKVFGESGIPADRWLVVLSAVVLAPLFEEMLFRAHIQTAIAALFLPRDRTLEPIAVSPPIHGRWIAILIASSLFALAHGVWWMMPPLFLLAVCLGYAYERTGNLWTSIVMHGTFNAVSITYEYFSMRGH